MKKQINISGRYLKIYETYAFQVLDRDTCRVSFSNINYLNEVIEGISFFWWAMEANQLLVGKPQ